MKTILITGTSKGIGWALAEKFLEEGHQVVCTSRSTNGMKPLEERFGSKCIIRSLDLQSRESIEKLMSSVKDLQFDIVIQNAGALVNKPFEEISRKELFLSYEVNILGPFQLQQLLMPLLKPDAHTVFISSIGGFQGSVKFPGLTSYSTSKAAIVSLTELLQEEYKDSQLAFNCLCLGAVQTEMLESAFPGYRAPLKPAQMADYIYQFSTTAHGYMRGKVLPISLSTP